MLLPWVKLSTPVGKERWALGNSEAGRVLRLTNILTVAEVALELRCSKAHIHNLINGKVPGVSPLPSLWLGRRRLVRRESLIRWLAANEQGARAV